MRNENEQSVWLPFPPSVNNLFSQGVVKRKIRRFPSKQYKAWRKQAGLLIMAARLKPYTQPVEIGLVLTPKDSRPRDADNYSKAVIDALVKMGVLLGDDSRHVTSVRVSWQNPDTKRQGVVAFIRPAKMEGKARALNSAERKMLERYRPKGLQLIRPNQYPGKTLTALIEKGYVETLPGLIPNAPQAFRAREETT
jgi:crossover junction endodeoxyribonuclease RusA